MKKADFPLDHSVYAVEQQQQHYLHWSYYAMNCAQANCHNSTRIQVHITVYKQHSLTWNTQTKINNGTYAHMLICSDVK